MDMELTCMAATPVGKLTTVHGQTLPDCGRSRMTAMLQEAYELHNDYVSMQIDGGKIVQVQLTDAFMRELQTDPEPRMLGGVRLDDAASMSIEQIDERTYRLTQVLECWQDEPRTTMLRFAYVDPHADRQD